MIGVDTNNIYFKKKKKKNLKKKRRVTISNKVNFGTDVNWASKCLHLINKLKLALFRMIFFFLYLCGFLFWTKREQEKKKNKTQNNYITALECIVKHARSLYICVFLCVWLLSLALSLSLFAPAAEWNAGNN